MSTPESLRLRIRENMALCGELHGAAQRAFAEEAERRDDDRIGNAQPETSDEAVSEATGRGWVQWCELIDSWPGHDDGHAAVAAHIQQAHGVDGWWAQTITVGWERITGRRLAHQRADGTFSASRTRTLGLDGSVLREMLLDDADRASLFPGDEVTLR
ncbi:MAG: hypothetical protein KDB31_02950, partial [Microthrixaceae bacterium]|nr:hypothetical protein [Microthrixaceae bacterium]